jgi:hypothetical protein
MAMKVIIAGSRTFDCYEILRDIMDEMILETGIVPDEIVSGTATGADTLGEQYARELGIPIKRFPADWNTHGKKAGHLRNIEMADYGDMLMAFWDGESKGTEQMIKYSRSIGLKVKVVTFNRSKNLDPRPPIRRGL